MGKLYYFQAPNLDINPESATAPRLGSIFGTLDTLAAPLNQFDHLSIPDNSSNASTSTKFYETAGRNLNVTTGINANALEGVAGSAAVVYAFARDKQNVYQCELLETKEFEPTKEYVAQCILASQRVQTFLQHSLFGRKHVYMVTGLKIATSFSKSSTNSMQHNPRLEIGIGATALNIPAQAGVQLDVAVGTDRKVAQGPTLNKIVFAYRVVRIKVKHDGEPRYKYKSGGKYGTDDGSDEDEEEDKWDLQLLEENQRLEEFPDLVKIKTEGKANVA
ncbi:hypothetical protein NM208_g303 [Fusarium decemcellulare]|uniref:Uncharacterized protein n=1 Tax=Fusarium decemcellulare TaxID=57161 RepID=A0ACC1T010_9HYPO|nr:hypothetical protein NM208_g303 [Fusarium decemcellulare]